MPDGSDDGRTSLGGCPRVRNSIYLVQPLRSIGITVWGIVLKRFHCYDRLAIMGSGEGSGSFYVTYLSTLMWPGISQDWSNTNTSLRLERSAVLSGCPVSSCVNHILTGRQRSGSDSRPFQMAIQPDKKVPAPEPDVTSRGTVCNVYLVSVPISWHKALKTLIISWVIKVLGHLFFQYLVSESSSWRRAPKSLGISWVIELSFVQLCLGFWIASE